MWFPKSKVDLYRTCGGACAITLQSRSKLNRTRPCETCGKQFIPRTTQLNVGHGRFCSQKCNTAARQAMQSEEAQKKARESWRVAYAKKPWAKRGADNPRWNGGKDAAKLRTKKYMADYKRRNPEKVKVWAANRRNRGGGYVQVAVVKELFANQKGRCVVCRQKLPKSYHLDHIQPVAKGGSNHKHNLQLLCPLCNARKGAKDPIKFMQSQGLLL